MAFLDKQEATGTSISLDCGGQSEADEELAQEDEDRVERETGEERSHILRFTGASFAWRKGGPTVLHNLNLVIPNGELTVIIGRVTKQELSSVVFITREIIQGPLEVGRLLCCLPY